MTDFSAEENTGTIPVQEKHQFDVAALQKFMEQQVEGYQGSLTVEEFAGGQSNPTYLLHGGGTQYVLRKKPGGELLKSAHAVDREYRVLTALQGADVPTAKTYAFCEDESILGTMFMSWNTLMVGSSGIAQRVPIAPLSEVKFGMRPMLL